MVWYVQFCKSVVQLWILVTVLNLCKGKTTLLYLWISVMPMATAIEECNSSVFDLEKQFRSFFFWQKASYGLTPVHGLTLNTKQKATAADKKASLLLLSDIYPFSILSIAFLIKLSAPDAWHPKANNCVSS